LLVHFGGKTNTKLKKTNMSLTDAKVRSLKAKAAQYKVSDTEGLYLLVPTGGARLWRMAYRFNAKQKLSGSIRKRRCLMPDMRAMKRSG
jgi:hypothetical protein